MRTRTIKTAPAFALSPLAHQRVNAWRYAVDAVLLLLLRVVVTPLIPLHGVASWLVSIYSIAAWITILTLHPAHLPDFSTTRSLQKRAWMTALWTIPLFLAGGIFLSWRLGTPLLSKGIPMSVLIGLVLPNLLDEILFRNVLPANLRRLGWPRWLVQITQSLLFTLPFVLAERSAALVCTAFLLSLHNGWLVMRTRTFWPGYVTSFLWRILFLA